MTSFDLAMPTDIRFGAGRVSEVAGALVGLGGHRVLVVTGRDPSRAAYVRSSLEAEGLASIAFSVTAEPSIDVLREAVVLAVSAGCDAVLGFGGGSAL